MWTNLILMNLTQCSWYNKLYEPRHLVRIRCLSITIYTPTILVVIAVLHLLGMHIPDIHECLEILPICYASDSAWNSYIWFHQIYAANHTPPIKDIKIIKTYAHIDHKVYMWNDYNSCFFFFGFICLRKIVILDLMSAMRFMMTWPSTNKAISLLFKDRVMSILTRKIRFIFFLVDKFFSHTSSKLIYLLSYLP